MLRTTWALGAVVAITAWAGCGGGSDGGGDAGPGIDATAIDASTSDSSAVDGRISEDAPPDDVPAAEDATVPDDATTPTDGPPQDAAPSGCSSPPAPTDPVECYQACDSTSECEWVDSDCCCNCFNGGAQTAINSTYSAQWTARQTARCAVVDCSGVGCLTVVVCRDEPPTCVAGRCM